MENKEEKRQEFDLEDILKEFSGQTGEETPEELNDELSQALSEGLSEEIPEETQEDAPEEAQEDASEEAQDEADEEPDEGEKPGEEPTIRLDAVEEPVEDAKEEPQIRELPPMTPPPIPFQPRSRLRELKRKLVAGPEKRYYELSEVGVGKLQLSILLSLLVAALCAGAAVMYAAGMVPENRMRLMVFGQVLALMVSALLSCYCLMDGIADLFKGRFTLNTLLFFTLLACAADAVLCLRELRVPCCAAFSLSSTMALWQRYQRRSTELGQMDTMRKANRLHRLVKIPDFYEGMPGILRGQGEVEDFMDTYDKTTGPERAQMVYALVCFLACIAIAVLAGVRHGVSLAIQVLSASLLVAAPASFFVALTRPMAVLERRLHMVGTVLCGWKGVKGLCGKTAFPLGDGDLFPSGSTKLNGVKFYGDRDPDLVVAYAAALIRAGGGGLEPIFAQLLSSRSGAKYQAENLRQYPGGGIGGEIWGESVLMGSMAFLQDMGVEIPEGTMVNQAVYCAIDGQLSAVFAITYARMRSSAAGLVSLCAHRKLTPVLTSGDFMLTDVFLKTKFGVNTKRMVFPPHEDRAALASRMPGQEDTPLALTTQDSLTATVYAVTGARALRTASRLGLVLHIIGGVLGMLIMLAVAFVGAGQELTPIRILLYQLVWMIPGLLITEWTRTV